VVVVVAKEMQVLQPLGAQVVAAMEQVLLAARAF
jgi:hypothetical protein